MTEWRVYKSLQYYVAQQCTLRFGAISNLEWWLVVGTKLHRFRLLPWFSSSILEVPIWQEKLPKKLDKVRQTSRVKQPSVSGLCCGLALPTRVDTSCMGTYIVPTLPISLCFRRSDSGEREREKNICSKRARPPRFFLLTSLCAVPSIWTPGTGYFSLEEGREGTVGTRLNNTSLNCDAWKYWRPTNVRPFKFVFFVFPIQTTWSSPVNFITVQTYARA